MQSASSITTRMQYQHKSLVDLIDGLTEEQLRRNILPGKWSIFENIVHLQTYQHTFCDRIKRMIAEDNPSFERYTAESDPAFLDNCHKSLREIMQDFIGLRKEMATRSKTYLEDFGDRTGTHPVFGPLTIGGWMNFFLLHEAHHLFTIFRLAAALRLETSHN